MGIVASVMCNCYRDGKTTPCPFPQQFIADPAALPGLRWDEDPGESEAEAAYALLRLWLATCCDHPDMNQASEFIASWKGYQAFSDALDALGAKRFPALRAHLPGGDDGTTPPDAAAAMLAELDAFAQAQSQVRYAVLVDSERGEIISHGSHTLKGALKMDVSSGFDVGYDAEGFFVRDRWEMNRLVFRAMRLEQRLLHPETLQVEYVDLETGRTFACNTPFGQAFIGAHGLPRMVYERLHVELLPSPENRFAYLTDPLRRVLQASLQTGNPVRWH